MYIVDISRASNLGYVPRYGQGRIRKLCPRAGSGRTWCSAAAGGTTPTWYFPSGRSYYEAARPDLTVSHSVPGEMGSAGSITEGTREREKIYCTMVLADTLVSGVRGTRHVERYGYPHKVCK